MEDLFGMGPAAAIEVALMQKRQVNVFQIPPVASAQGHCSADWRGKQIWTGNCQVMHELNKCCKIQLVNEDGTMFAQSTLTDGSTYDTHITRAYDSSRAFSLVLVSDNGQKATVGIMFPDRNDSFDFIQAMDNFKKAYRVEKGLDSNFQKPDAAKIEADLGLKEGEKISINFANMENKPKLSTAPKKASGGGLKKLAPPPGFKGKPKASTDLLGGSSDQATANLGAQQAAPLDNLLDASNPNSMDAILGGGQLQPVATAGKYDALADLDFSTGGPTQPALMQAALPQSQQPSAGGDFDNLFGGNASQAQPAVPQGSNLLDL